MTNNCPQFIALIPARGGSKSIPLKNIYKIAGKPLLYWVTKAAQECTLIEEIYVATESKIIENAVKEFNFSKLKIISRSNESATDFAATELVMLEFAYNHLFMNMILIQPTSPLLSSDDLYTGIRRFKEFKCDSLLSLVRQKRFLWETFSGFVKPQNYDIKARPLRQNFNGFLVENGAFYIMKREGLIDYKSRLFGNIGWTEMPTDTYYELDEPEDFIIMEKLLINRNKRELS